LLQEGAADAARDGGGADVVLAVALLVQADVVDELLGQRRGLEVGEPAAEVGVGLEDLAELLHAPVLDEELHAGPVAQAPVAPVAEEAGDDEPHVADVLLLDPPAASARYGRYGI